MCNFSKKGDKTESFLAMTVVAAEQLIQKHGPKYPAIHFRKRSCGVLKNIDGSEGLRL